jgi:hypothetical protein
MEQNFIKKNTNDKNNRSFNLNFLKKVNSNKNFFD